MSVKAIVTSRRVGLIFLSCPKVLDKTKISADKNNGKKKSPAKSLSFPEIKPGN